MHTFICANLISTWLLKSDLAAHSLCEIIVIFILFGIGAKDCDSLFWGWKKEVFDNRKQNYTLKVHCDN